MSMSGGSSTTQHIRWVDTWRGILILLVVFWHALGGMFYRSEFQLSVSSSLHQFIEHFFMISFFAVSGFVWKRKTGGFVPYLKKNFLHLMVPYYVFACFSLFLMSILDLFAHTGYSVLADIKTIAMAGRPVCYAPLWFLSCLFIIMILYYWLERVLRNWLLCLLVLMGVACLEKLFFGRLSELLMFNLVVVPRYLIAFAIGHFFGRFLSKDYSFSSGHRVVLFCVSFLILFIVSQYNIMAIYLPWSFAIPIAAGVIIIATIGISIAADNRILAWLGRGGNNIRNSCSP